MSDSKILVLGSRGQLGHSLVRLLGSKAQAFDRNALDLADPENLPRKLDSLFPQETPQSIINAAAYTQVDRAEQELDLARAVNEVAPGLLAKWCKDRGIPLIHYSTDYVFNGTGTRPWAEDDLTAPLNTYGKTKLAGEQAIAAAGQDWIIFRTSWVYSTIGQNFFKTMLRLGNEREEVSVVNDQHGAPTFATHLASATLQALNDGMARKAFPTGIYHLCNSGETTWFHFAEKIFEIARKKGMPLQLKRVVPVSTEAYGSKVARPKNSRLSLSKVEQEFGILPPSWEDALIACLTSYMKETS